MLHKVHKMVRLKRNAAKNKVENETMNSPNYAIAARIILLPLIIAVVPMRICRRAI